MTMRPLPFLLVLPLAAALALAGCTDADESAAGDGEAGLCAPISGEEGHPQGTTGSGTGDITTVDGGDPSRAPGETTTCPPAGVAERQGETTGGVQGSGSQDGASTGLGEAGGGFSTREG